MKNLAFLIIIIFIKLSAEKNRYNLTVYNSIKYNDTEESLTIFDASKLNENEILISYKIKKEKFGNKKLYYSFNEDYPDASYSPKEEINNTDEQGNNNEHILIYKFKKDNNKKFLVLENFKSVNGKEIEVQNLKPKTKVIVFIILSIIIVIIIIVSFIFIGKYVYNKRQKEIMEKYATSFVDDSLVPESENKNENEIGV